MLVCVLCMQVVVYADHRSVADSALRPGFSVVGSAGVERRKSQWSTHANMYRACAKTMYFNKVVDTSTRVRISRLAL